MRFVHIQRQFQAAFQEGTAFSANGFGMCLWIVSHRVV